MKNEVANQIDWSLPWTSSVYAPTLLTDGYKLLLVYGVEEIPHPYNKSTLKIIGNEQSNGFTAIVEFLGWVDFKFGQLDEDVIGNPNYIKGLRPYDAYEIQNSKWVNNLKEVFPSTRVSNWDKHRHYVLGFHDTRFECVAKSYYIEAYDSDTGKDIFEIVYDRITGEDWWLKSTKTDLRCPNCKTYLGKHFYSQFCMNCGRKLESEK